MTFATVKFRSFLPAATFAMVAELSVREVLDITGFSDIFNLS